MTGLERRAAAGLAAIFGSRMLGLFLILPIFSLYADQLGGSTPTLIGLAIGAYGLSQALLQIPMGLASDRFGRRPVIILGLLVFALGSVVAAMSTHIYGVILGRALQGSGAIAAAVMALAADLSRDSQRTKMMAAIGMSVGAAFMLAMVLGPLFAHWTGLSGVFWITALLALAALVLFLVLVPRPPARVQAEGRLGFAGVLRHRGLQRLTLGILLLHFILTAGFVALPLVLQDNLGLAREAHWQVYVPVLLLSVVGMVPVIVLGERRWGVQRVLPLAVALLLAAELGLAAGLRAPVLLLAALWLYFTAFNILEASLPSLVSRVAPPQTKGAALGVYSTAQFLGAFLGGVAGGFVYGRFDLVGVFVLGAIAAAAWLPLSLGLKPVGRTDGTTLNAEQ